MMRFTLIIFITSILTLISCEDIVSVEDISENQILTLAPSQNAEVTEGNITFTWSQVPFVTTYEFQIATPSFTNALEISETDVVSDTMSTTMTVDKTLTPRNYEWRVKGLNSSYETAYTTNILVVIPENVIVADLEVQLLTPEENFITTETSILFSWEELENIEQYRLIVTNINTDTVIYETLATSMQRIVTLSAGDYNWKVRGENETASTIYVERSLTIE
ncbi:hypothetical protein [Dokdonia sp. Hel_I_53]|uniref:hypothetical protein n=1 Tax=Dokdonia sp. Hel_I_53 TaxID=1566287 RepID=UPI00119936B1|nr:hypothetical protein [Dokdonia sp. Hel_I_53]TVZ52266.1 hypothetical protein OD90_1436 [Dokdonia sp. Hel_I_53]